MTVKLITVTLNAPLGNVVRIGQLGGDHKAKLLGIGHVAVAEAQQQLSRSLEHLLEQHGLHGRVELLSHVLQQHRRAVLNFILESAQKVLLGQLDYLKVLTHWAFKLAKLKNKIVPPQASCVLTYCSTN